MENCSRKQQNKMFLAWIGEAVTVMDNKGEKKEM